MQQSKALPGIYTEPYRTAPVIRHDDGSTSLTREIAQELLYRDVDESVWEAAWPRLRRQFWKPWLESCPWSDPLVDGPDLRYSHIAHA